MLVINSSVDLNVGVWQIKVGNLKYIVWEMKTLKALSLWRHSVDGESLRQSGLFQIGRDPPQTDDKGESYRTGGKLPDALGLWLGCKENDRILLPVLPTLQANSDKKGEEHGCVRKSAFPGNTNVDCLLFSNSQ